MKQLDPPVVVSGVPRWRGHPAGRGGRSGGIRPHWQVEASADVRESSRWHPWILLTTAEGHLASGLTALIIASVPIVGTIAAFALGDRNALRFVRIVGITLGLGGVALLVGRDLSSDQAPPWWSVAMVLIVVICYATAPFLADRRLADVPSLGVIAVSLSIAPYLAHCRHSRGRSAEHQALWAVLGCR